MPALRTISFRRAAVAALAGVMILSLLPATTMAGSSGANKAVREAEWQMLKQINSYRTARGLAPYRMAKGARKVARARSTEMRDLSYLSHSSPTGRHASTLLARRGVRYQAGAENIGRVGYYTWDSAVSGVMYGWRNSPSHNASVMSTGYNYVGVGAARNGSTVYFTTIFLLQRDHTRPKAGMVASDTGITVAASSAGKRTVTVRWWGRDPILQRNHAGISHFVVQQKRVGTGQPWRTIRHRTTSKSLTKTLDAGWHKFRVRAVDRAGNKGKWRRAVMVRVR